MNDKLKQQVAKSLTAEDAELLPFLPYLLQDLWELGSDPGEIAGLLKKHLPRAAKAKILDLCCGKGAVSVALARELGAMVKGVDMMPEFLEYAREKAAEAGVGHLCEFELRDAKEAVKTERGYDCVVYGAAGDALGEPAVIPRKLRDTVKTGGLVVIAEGYLREGASNRDYKWQSYEIPDRARYMEYFEAAGLELVEEIAHPSETEEDFYASETAAMEARCRELAAKYPDKRGMFEKYIEAQRGEVDDITNRFVPATWVLRKL